MTREKFMEEARLNVYRILAGKENEIMNIIQQAWTEGSKNVSVKTLRAALDEAVDKLEATTTVSSEAEPRTEPKYPTWGNWLAEMGLVCWEDNGDGVHSVMVPTFKMCTQIPEDIAQKLKIAPEEI